jgi:hypothetical protein
MFLAIGQHLQTNSCGTFRQTKEAIAVKGHKTCLEAETPVKSLPQEMQPAKIHIISAGIRLQ